MIALNFTIIDVGVLKESFPKNGAGSVLEESLDEERSTKSHKSRA